MKILAVVLSILISATFATSECSDDPNNLVPACGFENQSEIDTWTVIAGSPVLSTGIVHTGTGAVLILGESGGGGYSANLESECVQIPNPPFLTFGVFFQLASGSIVAPGWLLGGCRAWLEIAYSNDCSPPLQLIETAPVFPAIGTWDRVILMAGIGSTTHNSARISISCISTSDFSIYADDAFLGEGVVPVELVLFNVE